MTDKKKTILLIEDEAALGNILRERLAEAGYDVKVAIQGEEGWQKTKEELPDIVLLDILLPRIDGFVYLKRLRENKKLQHIPVIVLSNLGQDSDIAQGKELGAVAYLIKANNTIETILQQVKQVLTS
ncbi:MAG: response regulator [Candidatus Kerfeldbacteria bacterium]|nr:response regulator [Candidatus Kerfeldbacteria bacterium]